MPDLLPCPFCGNAAFSLYVFGRSGVSCTTCFCMMRGETDSTPEEVAKAWNIRTTPCKCCGGRPHAYQQTCLHCQGTGIE